jgi:hypothetical protein
MMATCYDCIHCEACSDAGDAGYSSLKEDVSKCKHFKNKADFVEVKHGRFVKNERNIPKMREFHEKGKALSMNEKSIFYTCSECGEWISLSQKYCSECGAIMDGRSESDDT